MIWILRAGEICHQFKEIYLFMKKYIDRIQTDNDHVIIIDDDEFQPEECKYEIEDGILNY